MLQKLSHSPAKFHRDDPVHLPLALIQTRAERSSKKNLPRQFISVFTVVKKKTFCNSGSVSLCIHVCLLISSCRRKRTATCQNDSQKQVTMEEHKIKMAPHQSPTQDNSCFSFSQETQSIQLQNQIDQSMCQHRY